MFIWFKQLNVGGPTVFLQARPKEKKIVPVEKYFIKLQSHLPSSFTTAVLTIKHKRFPEKIYFTVESDYNHFNYSIFSRLEYRPECRTGTRSSVTRALPQPWLNNLARIVTIGRKLSATGEN